MCKKKCNILGEKKKINQCSSSRMKRKMPRVQKKITSSKWPDLQRIQVLVFRITFENTGGNLMKRRMGLLWFDGNLMAGPSPSLFEVSAEMAISLIQWQFHEAPVTDWHPWLVLPGFKLRSNHRSEWFPECGRCSWDRSRGTTALPAPAAALPDYHPSIPPPEQGSHPQAWTLTFSQPEGLWEVRRLHEILPSPPRKLYHKSNSRLNAPLTAITCASPHIFVWRNAGPATWKPLSSGCDWVFSIPVWSCSQWLLNTATRSSHQDRGKWICRECIQICL